MERMWVELRRSLKFINKEMFTRYIGLETYRQMFLFHTNPLLNMDKAMKDSAKFGTAQYANRFSL